MAALATLDQLEAVCGPQADEAAALAALDQATTALQAATNQWLLPVAGDRVILDPEGADTLLLPELPVTAVGAVVVEGVALSPAEYEWSGSGILRMVGAYGCGPNFPRRLASVDVTYDHGYEPTPADLSLACAHMACRILSGGSSSGPMVDGVPITAERVGSYSVSYAQGLSYAESVVVDRYRVGP